MTNDDKLLAIRAAAERYCMTYSNRTLFDEGQLISAVLDVFGIHSDGTPVVWVAYEKRDDGGYR